jgi:hypothetical protein
MLDLNKAEDLCFLIECSLNSACYFVTKSQHLFHKRVFSLVHPREILF